MADPREDRKRFRCFCGACHVVTGTHICLLFYVIFSAFSMIFGMTSTLTWLIVPISVTVLALYATQSRKHKYLYPFLIVTVVQQLVCVLMSIILIFFSTIAFDTMRQIIGHSLHMDEPPKTNTAVVIIGGTVAACFLVSLFHVWQAIIIYRCLEYYEYEYRKLDEVPNRSDESRAGNVLIEATSSALNR